MTDLAASDTRTAVRGLCPRCGVRLCVDGEGVCIQCLDRAILSRQTTLDSSTLGSRA